MNDDISKRFTYHPPRDGQPEKYVAIRNKAANMAKMLTELCPPSRELSLAITKIEESVFWANASIARNPENDANDSGGGGIM